jgi:hypothetical protein
MKQLFLSLSFVFGLLACNTTDTPSPNDGTGNVSKLDASLPADFQPSGCFISEFGIDLSGAVSSKNGIKYTYDKLNRITKIESIADGLIGNTSYSYDTGKCTVSFDNPIVGLKGTSVFVLDAKNRVSSVVTKQIYSKNGIVSPEASSSFSYKYDENGYLTEDTYEDGKIKDITKYTRANGNLSKSETTRTVGLNPGATRVYESTYSYDTSKTLGTWDGGTGGISAGGINLQIGYFGKPNKNMINKIVQVLRETSTQGIVYDYTLTTTTDYNYSYDAKGYPSKYSLTAVSAVTGKTPLGIAINVPSVSSTGEMKYICK